MGRTARSSAADIKNIMTDSNLVEEKVAELDQLEKAEESFQEDKDYEGCATPMSVVKSTNAAANSASGATAAAAAAEVPTTAGSSAGGGSGVNSGDGGVADATAGVGDDVATELPAHLMNARGDYIGKVSHEAITRQVSLLQDMDTSINLDMSESNIAQFASLTTSKSMLPFEELSKLMSSIVNANANAKYNPMGAKMLSERVMELSTVLYTLFKVRPRSPFQYMIACRSICSLSFTRTCVLLLNLSLLFSLS